MLLCYKILPVVLWGPLFVGPLFGRTCWTCLNPPLVLSVSSGALTCWSVKRCHLSYFIISRPQQHRLRNGQLSAKLSVFFSVKFCNIPNYLHIFPVSFVLHFEHISNYSLFKYPLSNKNHLCHAYFLFGTVTVVNISAAKLNWQAG